MKKLNNMGTELGTVLDDRIIDDAKFEWINKKNNDDEEYVIEI